MTSCDFLLVTLLASLVWVADQSIARWWMDRAKRHEDRQKQKDGAEFLGKTKPSASQDEHAANDDAGDSKVE